MSHDEPQTNDEYIKKVQREANQMEEEHIPSHR